MKKNIVLTSFILGMATVSILNTGCNKPAERPSVVDSKIAANLMELKDIGEITSDKKLVFSSSGAQDIAAYAGTLKQVKLEGKVADILKKVSAENSKKSLEDQLKSGAIAITVLDDQIKILKVVPQTSNTFDVQVTSLTYLSKLKAFSKANDATQQQKLASEMDFYSHKSPADLGETFGLVEITSIKIMQHGNLDNDRTDYNEKKSILKVIDRPFDVSTHIVIGEEIGSEAEATAAKTAAEELEKAKK